MNSNDRERIEREIRQLLVQPANKDDARQDSPFLIHTFYIAAIIGMFIAGATLSVSNDANTQAEIIADTGQGSQTSIEPVFYVNQKAIPSEPLLYNDIPEIEVVLTSI